MNERLKELAEQAWLYAVEQRTLTDGNHDDFLNFQEAKFAELIIQECGEIAYGTYWQDPKGVRGIHIKDAILENFGVE